MEKAGSRRHEAAGRWCEGGGHGGGWAERPRWQSSSGRRRAEAGRAPRGRAVLCPSRGVFPGAVSGWRLGEGRRVEQAGGQLPVPAVGV